MDYGIFADEEYLGYNPADELDGDEPDGDEPDGDEPDGDEPVDFASDAEADADALRGIGHGTDEDYGCYSDGGDW